MASRSAEGSSLSMSGCTPPYRSKYSASDAVRPCLLSAEGPGEGCGPGVLEGAASYWAQ